jgi:hypothetical protein
MAIAPSITTNLEFAIEHGESSVWQETARTTTATETDPIGSISDESGNGLYAEQGTTGDKPTLNSDSFGFDGLTDNIQSTAPTYWDGSNFTIYVAFKPTFTDSATEILFVIDIGSISERVYLYQHPANKWFGRVFSGGSNVYLGGSSSDTKDDKQVICFQYDGTDYNLWVDGTLEFSTTTALVPTGIDKLAIGSLSASNALEMDLYGFYVYSTAHNDTDRGTIESDLTSAFISGTASRTPTTVNITPSVNDLTVANATLTHAPVSESIVPTVNDVSISNATLTRNPTSENITPTVNDVVVANVGISRTPTFINIEPTVNDVSVSNATLTRNPVSESIVPTVNDFILSNATLTRNPISVPIVPTVNDISIVNVGNSRTPVFVNITPTVNDFTLSNATLTRIPTVESIVPTVNDVVIANVAESNEVFYGVASLYYPHTGDLEITYPFYGEIEVEP